jgi:hypothetical protein
MLQTYIISFLILIIFGLSYLLYKKVILIEKFEANTLSNDEIFINFDNILQEVGVKLAEVDYKGSFESDDEIGFFFKDVKSLQQMMLDYKNI